MTDPKIPSMEPNLVGDKAGLQGRLRYDSVTMALHWITAILVVTLFSLAHIWDFFPHGSLTQITMQTVHVSLGVLLAAVLIIRLVWRTAFGRHLPPAVTGIAGKAASGMHYLLYALLIAMVVAGFGKRWARNRGVEFFGLTIPSPVVLDRSLRPAFESIHYWGAWAIITLAGLHAAAALLHHFVLRDGVLSRMLPGRSWNRAHRFKQ